MYKMKKLIEFCHIYVLLLGLTSYKLVKGRFQQTRKTQIYAWSMNLILLILLPYCLWIASVNASSLGILPRLIRLAHFGLNVVNYAVILYTVASRSSRDRMLLDLQKLTMHLERGRIRSGIEPSLKLRKMLYLKIFTVAYQTLSNNLIPFVFDLHGDFRLALFVLYLGYNTLTGSSYLCLFSFWHIAQGFDFINQSIEELITGLRPHLISHLWKMHMKLSRTARRINGYFQTQMLALMFNHCLFSVMDFYVLVHFLKSEWFPWYYFYFGCILQLIRLLDFFLNDYIIDLTVEYHHMRKDSVTEGTMPKELNAFILYEKSMKLDLMVCGLFKPNRNNWLRVTEGILCYFIVLMQFRLAYN